MRTKSAVVVACLVAGGVLTGCAGGGGGSEERTAQELLDEANATMSDLKSVTIEATTIKPKGDTFTTRLTTDLDGRCTSKVTWGEKGAALEQIRIDTTDYVRPNRAYLEEWSGKAVDRAQDTWFRAPVSDAQPDSGLSECTRDFTSFGTAKKGEPTKIDGTSAIALAVTDKSVKTGAYTFYVATEGEPYLLKVVYKGTDFHTTTTYSDFDKPLRVKAPAAVDVLDASSLGR